MSRELVRAADAAQYAREPIPEEQRGQIRVRLLNATPDPLGSIAALGKQYKGEVVRSLAEVTDEERRSYLDDLGKTVLNGPLEAAQFHFQIEGVTRSITHQMVRSRASFFAQESLRFAVPEGDWAGEIPLPPSLLGKTGFGLSSEVVRARAVWETAMIQAETAYKRLIELGVPAEEARGVLPHDMPTRIHWVLDLRTLLAEAGKRTCTQAQFPWRMIFAGMAKALRDWKPADRPGHPDDYPGHGERLPGDDGWQFREIADRLRPVCFQTGSCGFMADFDRSCSIRARVDANALIGRKPDQWHLNFAPDQDVAVWKNGVGYAEDGSPIVVSAIQPREWAADPGAARS